MIDQPITTCRNAAVNFGGSYPRSCPTCRFGPCSQGIVCTNPSMAIPVAVPAGELKEGVMVEVIKPRQKLGEPSILGRESILGWQGTVKEVLGDTLMVTFVYGDDHKEDTIQLHRNDVKTIESMEAEANALIDKRTLPPGTTVDSIFERIMKGNKWGRHDYIAMMTLAEAKLVHDELRQMRERLGPPRVAGIQSTVVSTQTVASSGLLPHNTHNIFTNVPGAKMVEISPFRSLEEHNRERGNLHTMLNTYPRGSGFGCPKCGKELMIMDGNVTASMPPQIRVECSNPACKHVDYVIA